MYTQKSSAVLICPALRQKHKAADVGGPLFVLMVFDINCFAIKIQSQANRELFILAYKNKPYRKLHF
jgi:hypothetical protein